MASSSPSNMSTDSISICAHPFIRMLSPQPSLLSSVPSSVLFSVSDASAFLASVSDAILLTLSEVLSLFFWKLYATIPVTANISMIRTTINISFFLFISYSFNLKCRQQKSCFIFVLTLYDESSSPDVTPGMMKYAQSRLQK